MWLPNNDYIFVRGVHNCLSVYLIVEPQEQVLAVLSMPNIQPHCYTIVPGIQRSTEIIRDNLGFMYYKNKSTENKMWD